MSDDERVLKFEVVSEILADVVIKENVIDPIYEISSGSSKGDGYTSFMTRVIVKGKNKVLPLIIKCALTQASIREALPMRAAYVGEINFYDKIFPALNKSQIDRNIESPFDSIPKCYKTISIENKEMLVLENMKEKGFEVFDKKKQMSKAHVELVLKTYGKFHALSFAMKEHDLESFEKLTKMLDPLYSEKNLTQSLSDMFAEGADKIRMSFIETKEQHLHDYFMKLKEITPTFLKSIANYKGKYGVITHGDCWCNNMMFKYEDENSTTPTDVCLFDFQVVNYTSPVFDIAYFFYVTADGEMLDNLDYYLKLYHDSLASHLQALGCNIEDHYPFSALKEEWSEFAKFGMILCGPVFRVTVPDYAGDVDFCDTSDAKELFLNESKYEHLINEKYRRLGLHFYKNKFSAQL